MNETTTLRGMDRTTRAHPCAFCGLATGRKSYPMPDLEVRDSQGHVLERQGAGAWSVCSDCDAFVEAGDEPGLSGRVMTLLASRAGRPLSVDEEVRIRARHPAFLAALPAPASVVRTSSCRP